MSFVQKLLLICFLLIGAELSWALCALPAPDSAFSRAHVVLSGTVIGESGGNNTVTLTVHKYFKGSGPAEVLIATASDPSIWIEDESFGFMSGKSYLVFVDSRRSRDELWMSSGCSGTLEVTDLLDDWRSMLMQGRGQKTIGASGGKAAKIEEDL